MPTKKKPAKAKQLTAAIAPPAPLPDVEVVAPAPTNPHNLPVAYDRLGIVERSIASKHGPLTPEEVKVMLGWETEKDYQRRMVVENPESKPEHHLFGDAVIGKDGITRPVHCLDINKQKVVCWNNAGNRPFDSSWCEDLIHTILYGQWAGPLMMPGETVNGETVRISRYGRMLSGQHQGTALILADEWLQKSRAQEGNAANPKYPAWVGHEHPVIETVVIAGLSEDERILHTIDYVKPRTTADMLYTMEVFRSNTPPERKEMTRMLASSIDLLWERTSTKGYKTHPEVVGFLERHKRLLKCVEHLFKENTSKGADGGRRISKLHISAGHAAALCYLMGSAGPETNGDVYRNEFPPSEKNLDWSLWEVACDFWTGLATDRGFIPLREVLGSLLGSKPSDDTNQGQGGLIDEKLAILAKAWEVYVHPDCMYPPFTEEDKKPGGVLCLLYSNLDSRNRKLPDGQIRLLDTADFYGIDCPENLSKTRSAAREEPMPPPLTQEEIDRLSAEALQRREETELAKVHSRQRRDEQSNLLEWQSMKISDDRTKK